MSKIIIIAEAGVNHNGDFELAMELVKAAAIAGADFVKFQTFKASKLVSKDAQQADYQKKNLSNSDDSQFKMLKKLEMPESWHFELKKYASELGIGFLSTGFDEESINFLDDLGISLFKIPSGEITNKPYLVHIASKKKPIILSTGMAEMVDIKAAIKVLLDEGVSLKNITVLHCNTEYPTPMEDVNLLAMNAIASELGVNIGYSDHTLGIEVPIAAVALGAKVIEKHFTLDKTMIGPDHIASLEPTELSAMVKAIRNIQLAIQGSGVKEPSESEYKNIVIARKSIHLKESLKAGHTIVAEDLEMKRPGDGISPMKIDEIIGKKVRIDLPREHKLAFEDLV